MMVKIAARNLAVVVLFSLLAMPVVGQDEGVREELEALRQGQEAMQKELAEIKQLIQARPAAAPARPAGPDVEGKTFDLGSNPVKGEQTARLTLIEWTDYQ